jgi:sulfur-carrier protein
MRLIVNFSPEWTKTTMARILYFAWVREKIGTPAETLELPPEVATVSDAISHLRNQGEQYDIALADGNLRVAVNQTYAQPDSPVSNDDEIAIFPPVSGG